MKKLIGIIILMNMCVLTLKAQWVVTDPTNLAQGIVNTTKEIIQTSKTASNMVSNFKETVKIYEQGKAYYDKLKSVNNLIKDARRVQQSVLMLREISDIYVNSFQLMLQDDNYSSDELEAIAFGYTQLLEEGNYILKEIKNVVSATGLSMTDKERMDIINRCYYEIKDYRNLTRYYTNKNISVSYMRSKEKGNTARILALYGSTEDRYW